MDEITKAVVLARLHARQAREREQRQLWSEQDDFKEAIRAKLDGLWEDNQFWNFSRCGSEDFYRTCKSCRAVERFKSQCNIKWCPRCQWRLAEQRKKVIGLWSVRVNQPKHLVLTQKNFEVLTPGRIREHTRNLAKIRRARCFKSVKGGCVSVEVTNEGKGWHLHSHWLLDARWLDMQKVAGQWAKLCKQQFAICKIMDVREQNYLREVSKYVVEGSDLAKWPAEKIHEFVRAVKGRRFFFPFGSLFHAGREIRAELAREARPPAVCDCGCTGFIFEDEVAALVNQLRREKHL